MWGLEEQRQEGTCTPTWSGFAKMYCPSSSDALLASCAPSTACDV